MKYRKPLFLNPYIERSATSAMKLFPATGLEYVAASAKEIVDKVLKNNGVVVINLHPRLLKNKMDFFEELIRWIKAKNDIWQCTMGTLTDYLDERWKRLDT